MAIVQRLHRFISGLVVCLGVMALVACEGQGSTTVSIFREEENHVTPALSSLPPYETTTDARDQALVDLWDYYEQWRSTFVKNRPLPPGEPVQTYVDYIALNRTRPSYTWGERTRVTVSEAHGYGMLTTVRIAQLFPHYGSNSAQAEFDAMVRLMESFPSPLEPRLMTWILYGRGIDPESGEGEISALYPPGNSGAATDGDLDMAMALLYADELWGSEGEVNYRDLAHSIMEGLAESAVEKESHVLQLGDWVSGSARHRYVSRPSDWMLQHFLAFRDSYDQGSPQWDFWEAVFQRQRQGFLDIYTQVSPDTGLIPDFAIYDPDSETFSPSEPNVLETQLDGDYNWNACRVPWRVADYLSVHNDPAMEELLSTFVIWAEEVSDGNPRNYKPGYYVVGGPHGTPIPGRDYWDDSFHVPLAWAAQLAAPQSEWAQSLYPVLFSTELNPMGTYFGASIRMLSLISATEFVGRP